MSAFAYINFPYNIVRSDRKTLAIEVKEDGNVVVRAPRRLAKHHIDTFLYEHRDWVRTKREQAAQRLASPYRSPLTEGEIDALYERARQELPKRVAFWAEQMGVIPRGITVTSAQKRFGSCSASDRLCFSYRLMRYPDDVIDYVIVHELAHILHHDHSRAFYACVAQYIPDYKEREKILKM